MTYMNLFICYTMTYKQGDVLITNFNDTIIWVRNQSLIQLFSTFLNHGTLFRNKESCVAPIPNQKDF